MAITRSRKRESGAASPHQELPPTKRLKKTKPITLEEIINNPAPKKAASLSTAKDVDVYSRRIKQNVDYASAARVKKTTAKKFNDSWEHMPASAQQGMHNPHVLCYRNSLLQSLLHSPKFANWARGHVPKDCIHDGKKPCIACALKDLMEAYWGGENGALHQSLFLYQKSVAANGGASGQLSGQADPEELLAFIARILGDQLPPAHFSIFESFSRMNLTTTMKGKCGHVTTTSEKEGTICLDIKPRIQGGDLGAYFNAYLNFDVEGYKCEECGNNTRKRRSRRISHPADMLVIQLKRFSWDGSKDSFGVPIPLILNLDKHRTPNNDTSARYTLSSVISHTGTSNFGHYICTAKDGDNNWHTFNDKKVTRTTAAAATHGGLKGFTPYVLFYQRQ